jgi:translocation and assembly module TamB
MSRPVRIIRNIAIGLAALMVVVITAALAVIHTDWFRNFARDEIVGAIESGTGGKAQIGSFEFDSSSLHAHITDLVIHGSEPADAAPFVRIAVIDLYAGVLTGGQFVGISSLAVAKPQVNILVAADGSTNVPTPKPSAPSKTTPLETVVDLAIGHFDLHDGTISLNSRKQPLDIQANNLRAQLGYHLVQHNYQGTLSLDPIYIVSGRNTPLTVHVTLPVVLERDDIQLNHASITTQSSSLQINGSLKNLRQPEVSARLQGHFSLAELKKAADLPFVTDRRGVPDSIDLDADGRGSYDNIRVSSLNVALGNSHLIANGQLRDPRGTESMHFSADLALAELARLVNLSTRPNGALKLEGDAKLDANNRYLVTTHLAANNLAVDQGTLHIRHAEVSTDASITPERIDLKDLHLAAFGGEFGGDASLEHFKTYRVDGNLRHLDIQQALNLLGERLPYDGVVSGSMKANGDISAPGTKGIEAQTNLAIAPGRRGIPVQGRVEAAYNGARDDVTLTNSYVALPHTRLTLAGSTARKLDVSLKTTDLHDLLAAVPSAGPPPVALNGGQASFSGSVTGALRTPRIDGHLAVNRFQIEGRDFNSLDADLSASPSGAKVSLGSLTRGPMMATFSAAVGLRSWSAPPIEPVSLDAVIKNGDLADVMVLAGQPSQGYSGALSANLHAGGTIGNPTGSADLHVVNGALHGEGFDRIDAQANLSDQLATIPSATLVAGNARADLSAEFQHPRDSFTTGRVHARLATNSIDLAQLRDVQSQAPGTSGNAQINADVTGNLMPADFLLTSLNADASVKTLRYEGQNYGDLQLQARTSGQTATVHATSDFAGSTIRVNGSTQLVAGYPTTADASISGLPIERVLTVAHQTGVPASGKLSVSANLRGPILEPVGDVSFDLTGAQVYDERIDRMHGHVNYLANRVEVSQFEVASGPSHIALTASFDHPTGNFDSGSLQFHLANSRVDLGRVHNVQEMRPGLAGLLQLAGDGAALLRAASPGTTAPRLLITSLNANVSATNLAANGKNIGTLDLSAKTTTNSRVDFTLNSDLAGSSIQATGNGQLGGDYPVSAQLTFNNVRWARLAPLLTEATTEPPSFDATADGKVSINGPTLQTDHLQGSIEISHLAVQTLPQPGGGRSITFQNQGPLKASLNRGNVTLDSFHFTGPQTDIQAHGSVAPFQNAANLNLSASLDLKVLQDFDRDITSSGNINLAAQIRGSLSSPLADGKLELRNANVNYASLPNGLSNANGVIQFRGNRATVQNLTAESGGGKISMTGFAMVGNQLRFALRATANNVRVRVEPGISLVADANVQLAGTTANSTASGNVTLQQLNYAPKNDLASILERAAPPVQNASAPSPMLDNMKLDVRVRTSAAMQVRSSLAENLQTDADLRVAGSAAQPSITGRINLTEGRLVFFGSTYNINTGSISFFNPVRIEPILNLSLETQAKGVDVVLNVTGPVDNMKLTYTSDPPLQFQEIVSLLAAGTTPTSDPTLLANQPSQPPQTFQQRGESAIVGQAIANPTAERLQRVFGVSQLKVDPTFTGSSQLPTAQVTLQQQVTPNITFTYVSALDDPNSTLIRAEWAMNQQWSAMAVRDQNGIFSVNLLYKKQFR